MERTAEAREALAMVSALSEPASGASIKAQWKTRWGWKPKMITAVWNELREAGSLHSWPGGLYWHQPLDAAVESRAAQLSEGRSWALPELIAAVCPHPKAAAKTKTILSGLVKRGSLRSRKLGKTLYVFTGAGALIDLLLRENDLTREDLRRYLDCEQVAPVATALTETELMAALLRMSAAPGAPVSLPQVRSAFPAASKEDFDRAVLALADSGKAYLAQHDHGWALEENERALLVHDGGTRLYVAITLRE